MTTPPVTVADTCARCNEQLLPGKPYCPNCGLFVSSQDQRAALNSFLSAKLDSEMALRLQDQESMVREVADKTEDIVKKRLGLLTKLVFFYIGTVLAGLTFLGIKSINDVEVIVEKRVEPAVQSIEKRSEEAQNKIGAVESRIPGISASLSNVAEEADTQRKRVDGQSAEITVKMKHFEDASAKAVSESATFETSMRQNERMLQEIVNQSSTQIAQITRDATHASIAEAYPGLDQQPIVMVNGRSLSRTTKKPGEKWVNIYLARSLTEKALLTNKQVNDLSDTLVAAGYRVIPGVVSFGGRFTGALEKLGPNAFAENSAIFYFDPAFRPEAERLCALVGKTWAVAPNPVFVTEKDISEVWREKFKVMRDQSGIDSQIFLGAKP